MELRKVVEQHKLTNGEFKFVTHCGVWWKVYLNSNYIEDFPYCPCCDLPRKLVQTAWYPEEKFKCPTTGTEIQLIDGVPLQLENLRGDLYESYFGGRYIGELFSLEFSRLKELHPKETEAALLRYVFHTPQFNSFPRDETEKILNRFNTAPEVSLFLLRNGHYYRGLLRKKDAKAA